MKSSLVAGAGAGAASEVSRVRSLQLLVQVSSTMLKLSSEEGESKPSFLGVRGLIAGMEAANGRTDVLIAGNLVAVFYSLSP